MKSLRNIVLITIATIFSANISAIEPSVNPSNPADKAKGIVDTTMVVPPDYEKNMIDLLNDWYLSRTVVERCNRQSVTPLFYADSVYIYRLQRLPYRIEMPFNSIVRSCIESYARRIRQVDYMLGLGEHYYFDLFEQALVRYNLPHELKYLPVIESALNPRAISRAGAGGLWQFMPTTGKLYDLEINSLVDDRFDPIKSSDAAARYLRDLNAIYDDWHLAIAAYNCGPGNVARAIRRSGGKIGYWDIYPYLPAETRGYVPIFIAANYIMNYYDKHNMCPDVPTFVGATDSVIVRDRMHFAQISEVLEIPMEVIKFLNPQYKNYIIPGDIKPYRLLLPLEKVSLYASRVDSVLNYNSANLTERQVIVEPPTRQQVKPATTSKKSTAKASIKATYKVKSGDTLGGIARRYGTTIAKIKKANGLRSDMIREGQTLKIPK